MLYGNPASTVGNVQQHCISDSESWAQITLIYPIAHLLDTNYFNAQLTESGAGGCDLIGYDLNIITGITGTALTKS